MGMSCFDFSVLWLIQVIERARELLESSGKEKKKKKKREKKLREPESFWNQVKEKKERKNEELLESGSKEKEKGEDVDNGIHVWWTKCKREKKTVWMKERQRIRNHNLKILPQYFQNKS